MSAALIELGMWIVNWRVVQAILSLWEAEESLQTMLMGAFNMEAIGMKNYVPEYYDMEKQTLLRRLNEISRNEFNVAPFSEGAFRAFFVAAYYSLDVYTS
jgi:hypothetical protein